MPEDDRENDLPSRVDSDYQPPVAYTNRLKTQQMLLSHDAGLPSDYEDHLIPLELGGTPRDPTSLWPEPHPRTDVVDQIETPLKRQACHGTPTLAAARKKTSTIKQTIG